MLKVLLAGGGTAGHVNPMLATAAELVNRGHSVAAIGTAQGLEADLVPRAGIRLFEVPRVRVPRRPSAELVTLPGRLVSAVKAAERAIEELEADVVVGFGGYVSAPAYLAARKLKVPVVVHEANVRPGLANRLGASFAAAVAITFEGTTLKGAVVSGLPLRQEIVELARSLAHPGSREAVGAEARAELGFPSHARVLVVTGGSTGAASLNAATAAAARSLVGAGIHVVHLTGAGKAEGALAARAALPAEEATRYVVSEYSHSMASTLAAADAVVCRAGAATVCELTALGIPALYVPLPHGNGEQALNAVEVVEAGAARLMADADLNGSSLFEAALALVTDEQVAGAMRLAARGIGIADGSSRLADIIERSARPGRAGAVGVSQ